MSAALLSGLIPTANGYGWTGTIPNQITSRWLAYLKATKTPRTIDIGAGLGVATVAALQAGASVVANDIEDEHLREIQRLAAEKGIDSNLELLNAALPRLPPLTNLDAVHASNVLHFLTGPEMMAAATWIARALKPQGKLFLQTISPFTGHFRRFASEYQRRKTAGAAWPGEMNAKEYVDPAVLDMTPPFMHVLEASVARKLFENAGFIVEFCDYYRRPGLPEICWLDGKENLGLVAVRS